MATKQPRIHKETERTKKLRDVWKRASQRDVVFTLPDESSARQLRFQLYNAVRAVRQDPDKSPELASILEVVQVSLEGEANNVLRIGRSKVIAAMDQLFEQLQITGEEVGTIRSQEEVDMMRSLDRLSQITPEV